MATIYSNIVSVTVQGQTTQFSATLSPQSDTITLGNSVTLTCTVSGGVAPYIYSWYIDGVDVGEYGSSYVYTPSTSGTHTVYVYVVDSQNNSTNSNSSTVIVNEPSVSYSVSVSASPSSNIQASADVTFTVIVSASDGSIPTGSATLYIDHANGAIWWTGSLTLSNGQASVTLQPGMYLQNGESYMTYYAIYQGFQSPVEEITFQTTVDPTSISLSTSLSGTTFTPGQDVTFYVSSNGSNYSCVLYAWAGKNTGTPSNAWGSWNIAIGDNGSGQITLDPSQVATANSGYCTWQVFGPNSIVSNSITLQEESTQITQISFCGKSTGYQGDVEFVATTNAGGSGTLYLAAYNYNPSTNTIGSLIWGPEPWLDITNGSGSVTLVPGVVAENTAWIAYNSSVKSNYVYVTGASSSKPGTISPTC